MSEKNTVDLIHDDNSDADSHIEYLDDSSVVKCAVGYLEALRNLDVETLKEMLVFKNEQERDDYFNDLVRSTREPDASSPIVHVASRQSLGMIHSMCLLPTKKGHMPYRIKLAKQASGVIKVIYDPPFYTGKNAKEILRKQRVRLEEERRTWTEANPERLRDLVQNARQSIYDEIKAITYAEDHDAISIIPLFGGVDKRYEQLKTTEGFSDEEYRVYVLEGIDTRLDRMAGGKSQ